MKRRSLWKRVGAIAMAVAMTAMMIPGVVSAGTETKTIDKIEVAVTAPVIGEKAVLPTIKSDPRYFVWIGDNNQHTGENDMVVGWVDQEGKYFDGTFEEGKSYTFVIQINGLDDNGYHYEVDTNETKVTIGSEEAKLIKEVPGGNEVYYFYGVTWKLESKSNKIVDGDGNETVSASSDKDLVLKCEKDLPEEGFKFYFGGKELTSNECKVEKGSTIVTVYASYLDTLPGGDYEVTFSYPDGNITNTVTLTKAAAEKKAPQTGEFSSMATTVLLISILGLAGLGFYAKKKEFF